MKNPHAKKNLEAGPISMMPVQKNKGPARRRKTMDNRFQGTRHVPGPLRIPKKKNGYYPHSDGLPY